MSKRSKDTKQPLSQRRHRYIFLLYILCCSSPFIPILCHSDPSNVVTYEFSGGRFGDNLLAYLHAKWISYRYQIPLLYKPFLYSSELVFDEIEKIYDPKTYRRFQNIYWKEGMDPNLLPKRDSHLFICHYFPECPWERANFVGPECNCFQVDWKDPGFRKILQEVVAPKHPRKLTLPPQNTINIAVHFREGGGYDTGNFRLGFLTKFPPLSFYIEGLLEIIELFQGKPLYCYLFSDALNPSQIIEQFKQSIPITTQIVFDCRAENNLHDANVLDDFFSLFHFDVLIHPQSNFSVIPSLIHDYAVTYTPLSGHLQESAVIIDKIKLEINEELCSKTISKISGL